MAGWLERRRLRGMMTPLLEGELDAALSEQVRARIGADPALSTELLRLEQAVGLLQAWPQRAVPSALREDLDLTLALEAKPLRARYGDLLDGSLGVRGSASLREQIAADPELDAEFALLQAGMEVWRGESLPPVPANLRSRISRAVLAEESVRIAMAPLPTHRARPRWAVAGAAAVLLFGLTVARIGLRPGTGGLDEPPVARAQATSSSLPVPPLRSVAAPTQPVVPARVAQLPTPAATAPSTEAAPTEAPAEPVKAVRAARNSGRGAARARWRPSEPVADAPNVPASDQVATTTRVAKAPRPLVVTVAQPSSASSVRGGEMPAPGTLNSVEPASSPVSIDLSSSSTRGGDL